VLVARVTGLVRWWELDQGAVYVHVRPCCGRHPQEPSSPCCKVRSSSAIMQIQRWHVTYDVLYSEPGECMTEH
jgi:hypothetical protein